MQNKSLSLSEKRKKLAEQKKQKKAKKAKKQTLKGISPSQAEINNLLHRYQNGQHGDAEKLAQSLTERFPRHQLAWKVLGAVLKQTGRISESLVATKKSVQLVPQDAEAHYNLGIILQELGKLDEAEASLTQTIALKPDFAKAQYNLGLTFQKLGRFEEAQASYKQTIVLKPDYARAHYNLGVTLQELGRLDEAQASYKQTIVLKPDYARAHYNLGVTLQELDRLDEAQASYKQVIMLEPDYAKAHNNLGIILQELGKLDEAEASFTTAIVLKPDFVEAPYNLGKVYKTTGKYSKAVEYFEKTLELSSEDLMGAALELAALGKRKIPDKTPEQYMQEFYRKKSKNWGGYDNQDTYRGHLLIENAFKKTHETSKQVEILDLGCGTGSLARFLRPYAGTLVGVDLSPDMLVKAKEICLYDSLYKKDLSQYLGEILNHYDTVVAAAVLIHFFDLDNIFVLVKDSLKINGKFIFSIFEETKKSRDLNSFLTYSHSDDYVTALADSLNLKISYRQKDIHEYHKGVPVPAIVYVLEKIS